jgi:hypothetical protein
MRLPANQPKGKAASGKTHKVNGTIQGVNRSGCNLFFKPVI